jgi:hypothetical protein
VVLRLKGLVKGSIMRGRRKKEERHNSGIDIYRATDRKIGKSSEYRKLDYNSTSSIAPILSFWKQQLFPMKWSEFYKEYLAYVKRMARINEEITERSLKMTQLCIELSENAQHLNELHMESIELAEATYKAWLNVTFEFWNRNEASTSIKKNETSSGKMAAKNNNTNLTNEEQKSINSMFKDSLTFD